MDPLGLGLIALGIVVIAAAVARALRPPPPGSDPDLKRSDDRDDEPELTPPPRPSVPRPGGPPTFRVVALGLEGSGKTVLLASMFHKLSSTAADVEPARDAASAQAGFRNVELAFDRGYVLKAEYDQDTWLAKVFDRVSDPHEKEFPPATTPGPPREFLFDCRISDGTGGPRTVFQVGYVDYAGDMLENEEHLSSRADLKEKVDAAHALFVMIDGARVRQLLKGERDGKVYFDRRIGPILRLAGNAACPVQLILTKWDLVHDPDAHAGPGEDEQLRRVIEHLRAFASVRTLIEARRDRGLRVIPVSAVGHRFTEVKAGMVVKRSDGLIDPLYVDVPLCVVLPDALELAERTLGPSVEAELAKDKRGRMRRRVSDIVAAVLQGPLLARARNALKAVVGEELVTLLIELAVRREPGDQPLDETEPGADTALARDRYLRGQVVANMKKVVARLEFHLPGSKLGD